MRQVSHKCYSFDEFTVDLSRGCLLRAHHEVKLRPKSFEAFKYLIENRGRLVTKEELIQALWPDSFVTDDSLVKCLRDVRLALGDDSHRYIKTVPRRGYIFDAEVMRQDVVGRELVCTDEVERVHVVLEEEEDIEDGVPRGGKSVEAKKPVQAMAPAKVKRYARAVALVLVAAFLVFTAGALLFYPRGLVPAESQATPIRSIAVLPLKNLTGDPSNEYFSDGMTESLIMVLSGIDGLKVISRGSVFRFKGKEVDPRDVGKQLGVASVLEGSVRKDGESVRVAVRLVSVEDGRVLWASDTYEQTLGDIFAQQDQVAQRVVLGLSLQLGHDGEQRLGKRYTDNVEAYQAYLKGRYFWNKRTEEGFQKAIHYFQQAIEIDPNYALAHAGLADSYILKRVFGLLQQGETPQHMEVKARGAAEKALAMDDTLAEAHTSLGLIKALTEYDEARIEREYKRAIELNPNYATAHHWYALYLNDMGRTDEALAEIRRAQDIDPLSLVINSDVGIVFAMARQYDQAIEHFKKVIEMDPNYPDAHSMLGWTYVLKGMYKEGIAEFRRARALFGSRTAPTVELDGLIYAYGISGNRSEALRVLDELKRLTKQHHTQIPWQQWVLIHTGLGEKNKAFEVLEKAHKAGINVKPMLNAPQSDPLRSDPRYADLRQRAGLAPQ